MAFESILNFFRLPEDGYEDEDTYPDSYEEEPVYEEPVVRKKKLARPQPKASEEREEEGRKASSRASKPKVVSMNRGGTPMSVSIIKPLSIDDSTEVCDVLMQGQPVIVNVEGLNLKEAQRIMDCVYGCLYTISGDFNQISKSIYLCVPKNVDIKGDSIDSLSQKSNKIPWSIEEY